MSAALYRKYRPQTFAQMIGQNHIKITVQHELERGETAHAYLFCGPRGLGKTTSARLFAKSINCLNRKEGESEPCNVCESCLEIMAGRSIDIIEIDAASNTGVENVRDNIIENSRFNPVKSKHKVFIIDEVHMLSTPAFNALLKTLEEPPAHVIFILCTTEIHKLPVTIISRCQRFDFKKVTGDQLLKRLELVVAGENKKVESSVLKRIVSASEGCVRDAESLLSKVLSLGDEISADQAEIVLPRNDFENVAVFVGYLAERNSGAAIELINKLIEEGVELAFFCENLLEFLRQILLIKTSGSLDVYGLELSDNVNNSINDLAGKFNWNEVIELIENFAGKAKEVKQSSIAQLPLEIAIIRICQPKTISYVDNRPTTNKKIIEPIKSDVQPTVDVKPTNITNPVIAESPVITNSVIAESPIINNPVIAESPVVDNIKDNNFSVKIKADCVSADMDQIIAKWPIIINQLIKTNFSLGSLLKLSQPIKLNNNVLEIAVVSDFYKGRLESNDNRQLVETVFESHLNDKILIKCVTSSKVCPIEIQLDFTEEDTAEEGAPKPETSGFMNSIVAPKIDVAEEVLSMF